MALSRAPSPALLRSLRALAIGQPSPSRAFSSSPSTGQELQAITESTPTNPPPPASAAIATAEQTEAEILGPRRRRLAIQQSSSIPFDQLPYQCFQEARKVLIADREEKLQQIAKQRQRIARLRSTEATQVPGGERARERSLKGMEAYLEQLKIFADVNDPNVKKRFEDGKGDMNKPVYRHLAEKKWREYRRLIQVQRIETLKVVPDVVPNCDPVVDITLSFGRDTYTPGEYVDSNISENPPRLKVQSFARGERLFTIAVVDPDVPNLRTDSFDSRCQFLATNISITPTTPYLNLTKLSESQILLPWLPPTSQKGAPYHRISIVLLQHKDNVPIDSAHAIAKLRSRERFSTRSFMHKHLLTPIGASLFRVKWDEHMPAVMARHNISGANVELKRKKVEPLPYKRRNPSSFR